MRPQVWQPAVPLRGLILSRRAWPSLFCLLAWLCCAKSWAQAEDPATACGDAAEAMRRGWEAIAGDTAKGQEPVLSVVEDAVVGKTSLRVEAKHPGAWQGLLLRQAVDLARCSRVEFFIKQNVQKTGTPWACAVQVFFADGGQALADPLMGLGEQWTKVSLPLRTPPWTIEGRPQRFGVTDRFRFYPYRELNSPGEYLQIDGLRFVPREEDATMETQGITYRYEIAPEGEKDAGRTQLLDGENSPDQQVVFAPYSGDPVVVFDLGEVQTLTRVVLRAYPKAGRNIASATFEGSEDGKSWKPVASLVNEQSPPPGSEQVLAVACLGVARHVRVTLRKPQVDVPLVLGEVVLERRATSAADRQYKPEAYFEGPSLPPVPANHADDREYSWLRGHTIQVAIHRRTGVIGGLWKADGAQVVLRGWDRYVFESREALVESTEYADAGGTAHQSAQLLIWQGTNGDLSGLKLRKSYRLRRDGGDEMLEKRTELTYSGVRPDQFATVLSNVALTEAFRRGGYYEGVQTRCDRVCADDVHFKRVIPPSKAVMLSHPASGETATQYRFQVNDRFCAPYYTQPAAETYDASSYNRCGWEIGHTTLKLAPGAPQSVRVHTGVVSDGRFGWERHFVSLPEYRAFVAGLTRPAWIADVKAVFQDTYHELLTGMAERTAERLLSIVDDGYLLSPSYCYCDSEWGDLPLAGDCHDIFGGVTSAAEIARILGSLNRHPRFKAGLYMWLQSVMPESATYRAHPDWCIATNKVGDPLSFFPTLKTNFSRILSAPGHQDFLVQQVGDFLRHYPQRIWYLDGGAAAANVIDWKTLRISQDYDGEDFCRRTRQAFRRLNPQGLVFFNDAEDRLADIGYAEIGTGFGQDWRTSAAGMYQVKVRQYFDPLRLLSPLYITQANSLAYLRLCTGLGLVPAEAVSHETPGLLQYAPYCSAAFETRGLQFSPTRVAPDWRAEADTPLEMYALRAVRGLVLSLVSHAEAEETRELRAQVPGEVAAPGETAYVVHHVLKDMAHFPTPISDFTSKAVYRQEAWAAGAVTEWRGISPVKVDPDGWISLRASLTPGLLNLFSVVREPAFYWSRDGLRANFLLPAVRGREIAVRARGDLRELSLSPETAPVEVLVLAPPGKTCARAEVKGTAIAGRQVALHGLRGLVVPVPPSTERRSFAVHLGASEPEAGSLELRAAATVVAGGALTLGVKGVWRGALCYSVWRQGALVHAGSADATGDETRLTIPVPVAAHDGEYRLQVGGAPTAVAEVSFTVTGHQQPEKIEPYWPPVQPSEEITPVGLEREGVSILSVARGSMAGGRPTVDTDRLTLRAEMPDETLRYYNHAHAGLELRGLRSATIRVGHNMVPQQGLYPARHVLLEEAANPFIGFFVDYGTPAGYTRRVAFSLGQMSLKRESPLPGWGAARAPERFLRLPATIFTGERVEGRLDFQPWAPPDWDGRLWVSLALDDVFRSRWVSLQLVALNPPAGIPSVKVEDMLAAMGQPHERTVSAAPFGRAPEMDGQLEDEAWKQARPVGDFYVVQKQGQRASQATEVRLGYDDRFLYLGVTCLETEKNGFTVTSGATGSPWWDDSVEFTLVPAAWNGRYLHAIVSADAVTYQETAEAAREKVERGALALQCHARMSPRRFTVEVAVPLGAGGLPAPRRGEEWQAQFMRTRVAPAGTREFNTWTISEGYHDAPAFGKLVFE